MGKGERETGGGAVGGGVDALNPFPLVPSHFHAPPQHTPFLSSPPGSAFPDYNVREYIRRRARDQFRGGVAGESAPTAMLAQAKAELEVWKRQGVVYGLYNRPQRSIMEVGEAGDRGRKGL